jgi:hypothetical protein
MKRTVQWLLLAGLSLIVVSEALALIEGGEGNKPLRDPGWPTGGAALINHPGRVAYWVGPPFGGGQWHAECRGDAKTLNAVLADFAKLDAKVKRVVVHDGPGYSFWLAPNREPEKLAKAKIDWMVTVWEPQRCEMLKKLPPDLNPTGATETSPPAQIDVYTANIRWADVVAPPGIEVTDNRLEAHSFTAADGLVFEGKVVDHASKQPIAATIRVERVETGPGGYKYPKLTEAKTDAQGKWVIKKAPAGWIRVVAEADGYAARVVGHAKNEEQPRWQKFDASLVKAVAVAGRVLDDAGRPLSDVEASLGNVAAEGDNQYRGPDDYKAKTDADGRFRIEGVPAGKAAVWVRKQGYVRPGLGLPITTPAENVELKMDKSASIAVVVDFTGKERPKGYIVSMEPEGGSKIGPYGGSGNIDTDGKMTFKDVPLGKYVVKGRPNPGSDSEETEPTTVDLKGGETTTVTLKAK